MGPPALGVDSVLAKSTCQGVCSLCGEAGWTRGADGTHGTQVRALQDGSECVLKGRTMAPGQPLAPLPSVHHSQPHRGSGGRAGDPLGALTAWQACQAPGGCRSGDACFGNVSRGRRKPWPELCLDGQPKGRGLQGAAHPASVHPGPRLPGDSLRGKGQCAVLMWHASWWASECEGNKPAEGVRRTLSVLPAIQSPVPRGGAEGALWPERPEPQPTLCRDAMSPGSPRPRELGTCSQHPRAWPAWHPRDRRAERTRVA